MNIPQLPAPEPRLPFREFGDLLARGPVGEEPAIDGDTATWERAPYRVVISLEDDGLHVRLFIDRKLHYATVTATLASFVGYVGREVSDFLKGPQPARPEPKKYPVDEVWIEAMQGRLRRVHQQVTVLMDHRRWDLVYQDILAHNPALRQPNWMIAHFHRVYVDFAVLAIRRQCKKDGDAVSLLGVMDEARRAAATLTREWYHRLWRGETKSKFAYAGVAGPFVDWIADKQYETFAGPEGERVDPDIIAADIEKVRTETRGIVDYADRTTAHDDKRGFDPTKRARSAAVEARLARQLHEQFRQLDDG
jgi:hypothetical protein